MMPFIWLIYVKHVKSAFSDVLHPVWHQLAAVQYTAAYLSEQSITPIYQAWGFPTKKIH